MNPITHFLVGWEIAHAAENTARDRALIALAGVFPDTDGLGVIVDSANVALGRPATFFYTDYHHVLLHGVLGAGVVALACLAAARRRINTVFWAIVAFHAHLLCDLAGSRGPDPNDFWSIRYLAPFSERLAFTWSHQWPLNGWPNVVLTVFLLGVLFVRANTKGYSPLQIVSSKVDRTFVATVRARWAIASQAFKFFG